MANPNTRFTIKTLLSVTFGAALLLGVGRLLGMLWLLDTVSFWGVFLLLVWFVYMVWRDGLVSSSTHKNDSESSDRQHE